MGDADQAALWDRVAARPDPDDADQDGLVVPAVIWAALDCPSGFAAGVGGHRDG